MLGGAPAPASSVTRKHFRSPESDSSLTVGPALSTQKRSWGDGERTALEHRVPLPPRGPEPHPFKHPYIVAHLLPNIQMAHLGGDLVGLTPRTWGPIPISQPINHPDVTF